MKGVRCSRSRMKGTTPPRPARCARRRLEPPTACPKSSGPRPTERLPPRSIHCRRTDRPPYVFSGLCYTQLYNDSAHLPKPACLVHLLHDSIERLFSYTEVILGHFVRRENRKPVERGYDQCGPRRFSLRYEDFSLASAYRRGSSHIQSRSRRPTSCSSARATRAASSATQDLPPFGHSRRAR